MSAARDAEVDWEALFASAWAVRQKAHVPYSHFAVGAAGLFQSEDGARSEIVSGCNVENASYGLGICAERNAIARAVADGLPRLRAIAVVAGTATPCPPCGACRQVIFEFAAPDVPIRSRTPKGDERRYTVDGLLPDAFDKDFL